MAIQHGFESDVSRIDLVRLHVHAEPLKQLLGMEGVRHSMSDRTPLTVRLYTHAGSGKVDIGVTPDDA
ncbi:hypothetical protein NHX12_013075 [Muraenolepis orangiensis]|uniref:Uncharacterized protein n=1 Tax=Muraenolepis orangiensis TaxID=630683 RepID=A0A9Q0DE01_9TELE|nr:hypothetical protein NHX12_013075 [Muraenolepis orangiensis]